MRRSPTTRGVVHDCSRRPAVDLPLLGLLARRGPLCAGRLSTPHLEQSGLGLVLCLPRLDRRQPRAGEAHLRSGFGGAGQVHEQLFITPTIFNNVLWNAVVEDGDGYLLGQHSIFDEVPIQFHRVEGWDLLRNLDTDETLRVLRWFSDGHFNAVMREDGSLQLNDLRFGTFSSRGEGADDYIFRFTLIDNGPDQPYGFSRAQGGPPDQKGEEMMEDLIDPPVV